MSLVVIGEYRGLASKEYSFTDQGSGELTEGVTRHIVIECDDLSVERVKLPKDMNEPEIAKGTRVSALVTPSARAGYGKATMTLTLNAIEAVDAAAARKPRAVAAVG